MRSLSLLLSVCGLAVVALCGTQSALGAALWTGSASNDFNSSSNWVDDDSGSGPKSPSNANCILYATGASHLSDVQVTSDISLFSVGLHKQGGSLFPWNDPVGDVTINSSENKTITFSAGTAVNTDAAGLGTMTVNAKLATSYAGPQEWMAASNVVVNGDVATAQSTTLTKKGGATLTFGGNVNPNGGHMDVQAGTVTFGNSGSWTVRAYNGDTYTGSIWGTGTLNFNGTLKIDGADAAGMTTGSWEMISTSNLTESYGGTFAVAMASGAPFANNGGVWSYVEGPGRMWTFDQASGVLTLGVPEPGAVVLMLTGVFGLLAYAWRRRK